MLMKSIPFLFILLYCIQPLQIFAQKSDFTLNTVVIDPGHGGKDPGTTMGLLYEKDIVLHVALMAGQFIKDEFPDVKVVYTRDKDVFIPLDERANIANKKKADLFISIHVNYYQKEVAYGAETYILGTHRSEDNLKVAQMENSVILLEDDYTTRYEGFDPNSAESYIMFELIQNEFLEQSRFFAEKIQSSFADKAKRHNRGVKQAGFLVLRKTVMPSILIELGYISNNNEKKYLETSTGREELARAIAAAFSNYKKRIDSRSNVSSADSQLADVTKTKPIDQENTDKDLPKTEDVDIQYKIKNGNWYAVQILANSTELRPDQLPLKDHENIFMLYENGWYKYFSGFTQDYNEAIELQKMFNVKFKGAFLVVFRNGIKEKFQKF